MRLKGKKIAMFVEDIYEDLEFWYPYYRMKEEGAKVTIIGSKKDAYTGKNGITVKANALIEEVKRDDYAALIIPGGYAPDHMRRTPAMVAFVKQMHLEGKVIAAICHAGWLLTSAGIVEGRKMTSFFSIKDDMVNAGAEWVDEEVVRTDNLITSRQPGDLPAFCRTIIGALS